MPPFDIAAAWAKLSADDQRAFGHAAILTAIGQAGSMESMAHDAAFQAGLDALQGLAEEHLSIGPGEAPPLDLDAIGIRSCAVCGCTDLTPCEDGCEWVAGRLCSACAPLEGRP